MNANINLLLRKDEELLKREKRARILNFIAVVFLVGTGVISLALFLSIQSVNISVPKKELDEIHGKISNFQTRQIKLLAINDRINTIQEIFDKRQGAFEKKQNLAKTTDSLLAKVPDTLSIKNLEVDDKIVIIEARSTSLFLIGELINNLTNMVRQKEIISSLTLENLLFDESQNFFLVSLKAEL